MLVINSTNIIPVSEISFQYVRSGGPGGQNVNKVNTKAVLKWNVLESPSASDFLKQQVLKKFPQKVSPSGEITLSSSIHRQQKQNKIVCLKKLENILKEALRKPKKRIATRPSKKAQQNRVDKKRKQGELKKSRAKNWD